MHLYMLLKHVDIAPATRHFRGPPPTHPGPPPVPFPRAAALLIEDHDGRYFLIRVAEDGQFAGDTWHPTLAEAQRQASAEYGDLLQDWRSVPDDAGGPFDFLVQRVLNS
jgi:hypothetical protein